MKTNKRNKRNKRKKNKTLRKKNIDFLNIKPEVYEVNDYKIILLKIPNNTVYIKSFVNIGFIDENKNNSGINHLLEHVLINSYKKCNNKPCLEKWKDQGVYINAETSENYCAYYTQSLEEDLHETLDYIIKITTNAKITKKNIDIEKNPVKNELLMYSNLTDAKLHNLLYKKIYNKEGLNYASDFNQQLINLSKLKKNQLEEYYKKNYSPKNTFFVVSGHININEVLSLFKSKLPKKQVKNDKIRVFDNCFSFTSNIIYLHRENTNNSTCLALLPTNVKQNELDLHYLRIATMCLRELIFIHLRYNKKIIYRFSTKTETSTCGTTISFKFSTPTKETKNCYDELKKQIHKYKEKFIPEKQINSYKKIYLQKYFNFPSNPQKIGLFYGVQYLNQLHLKEPFINSPTELKNIIMETNKHQIQNIIKKYFNLDYLSIAYESNKKLL